MLRKYAQLRFISTAFCLTLAAAFAQELKITGGVVPFQIVQRDADGRGVIRLSGTALKVPNKKYIEAKVFKDKTPAPNTGTSVLTEPINNGKWAGEIKNVPAGGPYRIELMVSGMPKVMAEIDNIFVGDLWVLGGQSNMEGVGDLVDVQAPVPSINTFNMSDTWEVAKEPLHRLKSAVDPVHWAKNDKGVPERWAWDKEEQFYQERKKGAGLGLPFAVEIYRRSGGLPVGLIPCAHGGTSMDQWDPALKDKGGESLYGSTIRRINAAGGKVRGILWYQGESDANEKAMDQFPVKFANLVAAFRKDLNAPDLPFYYVQIGRFINNGPAGPWNRIQEYQRQAESKIPKVAMVTAVDAQLDDLIHVGTQDLKRLGRRMALLAAKDMYPTAPEYANIKRGPRPVSAKLEGNRIVVKFAEVNGSLVAEGRISGFSVHDASGALVPLIFRANFDPKDPAAVHLHLIGKPPEKGTLYYGYSRDPNCNIRDTLDMALPAFGPMPIQ